MLGRLQITQLLARPRLVPYAVKVPRLRKRPKFKKISTSEGFSFGITMLAQVTGILILAPVLGVLADRALDSAPIGLAAGVLLGGTAATILILTKVKKELDG